MLVGYGSIHRLLAACIPQLAAEQKLYTYVPRVVTIRTADTVTDPVPNRLNGAGQLARDRPLAAHLTICTDHRPPAPAVPLIGILG